MILRPHTSIPRFDWRGMGQGLAPWADLLTHLLPIGCNIWLAAYVWYPMAQKPENIPFIIAILYVLAAWPSPMKGAR